MNIDDILGHCDAVILAGGQATRMGGCNKLLQCFDGEQRQLEKLLQYLKPQVHKVWINSHRDSEVYQAVDHDIGIFSDIETGFLGPMIGMMSAWLYSQQDWILFVPCDLYQIPKKLLQQFATQIAQDQRLICYAQMNEHALYPLCLMHRTAMDVLVEHLEQKQRSLYRCFKAMDATWVHFDCVDQQPHSINTWSELSCDVSGGVL